jgi:hypothetical protein
MGPTTTIHPEVPRYKGYGVSSDGTYITWNTENLLWLPPEYRPETFAISQAAVCFGCASGQVLLFIFDSQNLPC